MDSKKKSASQRPRWLGLLLGGAVCAGLTAAAVWYDLTYNGGKLVYPMHSYAFAATDIPMLLAAALDVLYVLYLAFLLVRGIVGQRRHVRETGRTRRLSPKLGLLGFCGFFGFDFASHFLSSHKINKSLKPCQIASFARLLIHN